MGKVNGGVHFIIHLTNDSTAYNESDMSGDGKVSEACMRSIIAGNIRLTYCLL